MRTTSFIDSTRFVLTAIVGPLLRPGPLRQQRWPGRYPGAEALPGIYASGMSSDPITDLGRTLGRFAGDLAKLFRANEEPRPSRPGGTGLGRALNTGS